MEGRGKANFFVAPESRWNRLGDAGVGPGLNTAFDMLGVDGGAADAVSAREGLFLVERALARPTVLDNDLNGRGEGRGELLEARLLDSALNNEVLIEPPDARAGDSPGVDANSPLENRGLKALGVSGNVCLPEDDGDGVLPIKDGLCAISKDKPSLGSRTTVIGFRPAGRLMSLTCSDNRCEPELGEWDDVSDPSIEPEEGAESGVVAVTGNEGSCEKW